MTKARVLIAEDDADMRDLLQEVLEDADYETIVAGDGEAAMNRVVREREMIDLLVTDVRMPKVTGEELLEAMREKRAEAPVILDQDVQSGRFREDLYWRLNVLRLRVPPLRDRAFDIPMLVEHFVNKLAAFSGSQPLDVSQEALAILTAYSWPGNVRELENAIERAVAFARGTRLMPEDLPERVRSSGEVSVIITRARAQRLTMRELEREYILETLRDVGGNKSRTAELLGLDRKTLYRKLDEYRADSLHQE